MTLSHPDTLAPRHSLYLLRAAAAAGAITGSADQAAADAAASGANGRTALRGAVLGSLGNAGAGGNSSPKQPRYPQSAKERNDAFRKEQVAILCCWQHTVGTCVKQPREPVDTTGSPARQLLPLALLHSLLPAASSAAVVGITGQQPSSRGRHGCTRLALACNSNL